MNKGIESLSAALLRINPIEERLQHLAVNLYKRFIRDTGTHQIKRDIFEMFEELERQEKGYKRGAISPINQPGSM